MKLGFVIALALVGTTGSAAASQSSGPTCSDIEALGLVNHGEHIVADYVSGIGRNTFDWPPSEEDVGGTTGGNRGAVKPGGASHPSGHLAPGASFCTDSNSPGTHL